MIVAAGVAAALAGCDTDPYPVDRETSERMASELEGRSFRQFDPSKDGSPRMAVILDFHDGLSIWGQYSRDGHAVNEWEIRAGDYRIGWTGDDSEIVLVPLAVTSEQQFPRRCTDCVPDVGSLDLGEERVRRRRHRVQDQRPKRRPPSAVSGIQVMDPIQRGRIRGVMACRARCPQFPRPRSSMITWAALWPGAPVTSPPGCVPAPHIYRPRTGVR